MININIPIFRAKKIDSDEYVVGYYSPDKNYQEHIHTIFYFDTGDFNVDRKTTTQIDISTIAIHFPDMLDGQKNKIFASLSKNGKGGDIITYDEDVRIIAIYKNGTFIFKDSMNLAIVPSSRYLRTKVIGIQK